MAEKEYIEREAIIKKLREDEECDCELIVLLYDYPAADVAPVKHGHWTEKKSSGVGGIWDYYFVCSVCGGSTPNKAYVIAPDFCPNCGARMNGGENNGINR